MQSCFQISTKQSQVSMRWLYGNVDKMVNVYQNLLLVVMSIMIWLNNVLETLNTNSRWYFTNFEINLGLVAVRKYDT